MITGRKFEPTTRYFDFPLLIGFVLCQLLFELLWVGVVHFKEKFIGGCIGIKFLNFLKCSFIKRAQRYSRLLSVIVNKVNLAGENIQDSFIFHRSQTLCKWTDKPSFCDDGVHLLQWVEFHQSEENKGRFFTFAQSEVQISNLTSEGCLVANLLFSSLDQLVALLSRRMSNSRVLFKQQLREQRFQSSCLNTRVWVDQFLNSCILERRET